MTIKEFSKIKPGSRVAWREGYESPRRGEITDYGAVLIDVARNGVTRKFIKWEDGQETDSADDWALKNVEKAEGRS